PGEFADGVLETNQRRNPAAIVGQLKDSEFSSEIEILRHLVANNCSEQREGMTKWHEFAKRHEMDFAVKLRVAFGRKEQSSVVDLMRLFVDRAKQQIDLVRAR